MLTIDGSYKEGGGQILRTAVALSAVTQKPIKVSNIRAKRCNPGLRAQHVCAINAVSALCNAETRGVEVGSKEIEFCPKEITEKTLHIALPTAGAISLVLQALLIPGLHIKKTLHVEITGGATYGKWAPPIAYTQNILQHVLSKIGYNFKVSVLRHGFYPKGGARVSVAIEPVRRLRPFDLQKAEKMSFFGLSVASMNLKNARVAERQKKAAEKRIAQEIAIKKEYVESDCAGSAIVLWAKGENSAFGTDALGERGVSAEKVGFAAGDTFSKICMERVPVDRHLADQLIPFLAFAGGKILVEEITPHTETNIWVTEKFLGPRFNTNRRSNTISVR